MAKTILLVHGRDFKPPKQQLSALLVDALRFGLTRDHAAAKARAFDRTRKELVYYADLSRSFLIGLGKQPPAGDTASRRQTLHDLKQFRADQFTKSTYGRLPGKASLKESLANVFGPLLGVLHLADDLIARVAPDIGEYWNPDSELGSRLRERMIAPLSRALSDGDDLLVIAHSLGTLIAYDTFWKFSHTGEYREEFSKKRISLWITCGSPLGDPTVKRKLKGAEAEGPRRYPSNIDRWANLAAEDDYIAYDPTVRDEFREMEKLGLVRQPIEDHRIYNLAVRNGRSNPHHDAGYLIHPKMAALLAGWL